MSVRVLLVRGHSSNPWELRPWRLLSSEFDVGVLVTQMNSFDVETIGLDLIQGSSVAGMLPGKRMPEMATAVAGDRYRGLDDALARVDIVHVAELSYWFSADVLRRKQKHRFSVATTVWETIPFLTAYRSSRAAKSRRLVMQETDVFIANTERASRSLVLEGVAPNRIVVSPPGIGTDRFRVQARPPAHHLLVSPGRLVWEKGHQDVIRAVAAIAKGMLGSAVPVPLLQVIGVGPERRRLMAHAKELGVAEHTRFVGGVPYDQMPALYSSASAMVLASLPFAGGGLHPLATPRTFWEEQFGMVLAEGLAAGVPIHAAASGAIPEVLCGQGQLFEPGDWFGLAKQLVDGPLSRPPGQRMPYSSEVVQRYSDEGAARRLEEIYSDVIQRT